MINKISILKFFLVLSSIFILISCNNDDDSESEPLIPSIRFASGSATLQPGSDSIKINISFTSPALEEGEITVLVENDLNTGFDDFTTIPPVIDGKIIVPFELGEFQPFFTVSSNASIAWGGINRFTAFKLESVTGSTQLGSTSQVFNLNLISPLSEYLENFDDSNISDEYGNGSFVGKHGILWNYVDSRNEDDFGIDGKGIILRGSITPSSISATIDSGIRSFAVDARKASFSDDQRILEVLVDDELIGTFEPEFGEGEDNTIFTLIIDEINIAGSFELKLRIAGEGTSQEMTLDNLTWTPYED